VADQTNKSVLLRPVKYPSDGSPKPAQSTGIIFESLAAANCLQCNAVIPLENVTPLSRMRCPACGADFLVPGLVGGFLLHEHIGEGEMGTIYRATDEALEREVAVKLVRGCHIDDPESRERLQREACAAGKMNHPRVAQVYALNFSNGHPYLVMELVTGQDFAQRLECEGPIHERSALRMALDVAEGLSALNREGLVHGDIKPGNVVQDRDGNAKLVDFGLSGMTRHDQQGSLVGTPNYIAPELLRGAADTHRSDIYSLGATLYYLLCGRLPFEGESSVDILKARLFRKPVPLGVHARHVSLPTQRLVMRMIESNPEKRPASSEIVAAEIKEALIRLDATTRLNSRSAGFFGGIFQFFRSPAQPRTAGSAMRRQRFVTLILCSVVVAELLIAYREKSFQITWEWLRTDVAAGIKNAALAITQFKTAGELPAEGSGVVWQSMNLGQQSQRGSTLQSGEVIVVQGTGSEMWEGYDRCRFVGRAMTGSYVFSTQIQIIADANDYDISALLIKGDDPLKGPGLLFGLLGSGQLFLQLRNSDHTVVNLRISEQPLPLPGYLRLIRNGHAFEAFHSVDGRSWESFAACELELPARNTVGLAVSSQEPGRLVSARFAGIHLQPLVLMATVPSGGSVPAAIQEPFSSGSIQ